VLHVFCLQSDDDYENESEIEGSPANSLC